jgi:flagellar motor component MotA
MNTFTKWFLLNSVFATACVLAEQRGMLSMMIKNDSSYICVLIMLLYIGISAFLGRLSYSVDKMIDSGERKVVDKGLETGWFFAEHFFTLGLLGTLIGLCMATQTSLNDTNSLTQMVGGMKSGLNTAFFTTIFGIVFSLPVQIQLMILKGASEK